MSRLPAVAFGVADLVSAALVVVGVFAGLPDRWWPVDAGAALLTLLLATSGCALCTRARWAPTFARAASAIVLALGLALVAILALTASYLSGIYGPVGRGGAIIYALVAALALPYLVALPSAQLLWLGRARARERAPSRAAP